MPAYHSQFNEPMDKGQPIPFPNVRYIGSIPLLPIKTVKFKGPAPPCDKCLFSPSPSSSLFESLFFLLRLFLKKFRKNSQQEKTHTHPHSSSYLS